MDAEMHSCVGLGTLCADFWSVMWLLIKLNSQVGRSRILKITALLKM